MTDRADQVADQASSRDTAPRPGLVTQRGIYGMACWNALSEDQQTRLITWGNLPLGYRPEGTECHLPATVGIEVEGDPAPGPRFYCRRCAIRYLEACD